MSIYERDYTVLTSEETELWEYIKREEVVNNIGGFEIRKNLFREYPKAARHYMSLFPNNYLDIEDLNQEATLRTLIEEYRAVLENPETKERQILNWIRDNKAYFIIASIFSNYNFGHHEAYIFREFRFGTNHTPDFMLIGKNSGGYEFILVELEAPSGRITMSDGELGEAFRKGISQVEDWDEWLEANFSSFKESIMKYKHPKEQIPLEFFELDKTRFHYVVVAGRRTDFNEKTYRIKRRKSDNDKILLLHYDNLYDMATALIGKPSY